VRTMITVDPEADRRGRRARLALALVLIMTTAVALIVPSALAAATAGPRSAPPPPWGSAGIGAADLSPASVLIPCTSAGDPVVITADSHLDPACTYTGGITISTSNVQLDCQGATIQDPDGTHSRGIEISTPVDTDLADVTVRNCKVRGFVNGIRTTRDGFRALAAGVEYVHGLTGVVLDHVDIADTRGSGIYIDGYVTKQTISNSKIVGAGSVGIYLEAGSADNVIVGNELIGNGFKANGPDGQLAQFAGTWYRYWGTGREAIAIDGSRRNRIADNHIADNSYGGVLLYKNCGEYVKKPAQWFERRYGADDNVIEGNTFDGGPNGVWVASRQNENVFLMECSDPPYLSFPALRITRDYARNTTIRNNTFNGVEYGVRIEDDGAVVQGNTFTGADATRHGIIVGTKYRTTNLAMPVDDTTITGNVSTIVGNLSPYRFVHAPTNLVASGNVAAGQGVGLCEGKEIPSNNFIFVVALAPEKPGDPVTPTPDLTKGSIGALAPCPGVVAPTSTTTSTTTTTVPESSTSTSTSTSTTAVSVTPAAASTGPLGPVAAAAPAGAVQASPAFTG
jgi:nitrous oxidase accessory protein NosD